MFCRNCGREIPENVKFCNYCGTSQNNSSAPDMQADPRTYEQQPRAAHSSNAKKSTRKKVGIVLICLQVLALIGGISSGTFFAMLLSGPAGFFELIGYCLPGIIGAILIYKADKNEKKPR